MPTMHPSPLSYSPVPAHKIYTIIISLTSLSRLVARNWKSSFDKEEEEVE